MNSLLNDEQMAQYHEDGFLHVKELFNGEKMKSLVECLNDLAARRTEYPELLFLQEQLPEEHLNRLQPLQTIRKINHLQNVPEVMRFFDAGSLPAQIAAQLIRAKHLRMMGIFCFAKPAGHGTDTPWHQDQALWSHWLPTAVSCWVAIDRCTLENGCLQFLQGSHKQGMAPAISTKEIPQQPVSISDTLVDRDRVVKLEMESGDVVFFGGRVWHHSESNLSGQRRLGMPAVYCADAEMQEAIQNGNWCNIRRNHGLPTKTTQEFYNKRPELVI
jgi:ectoine hydroxylase-related dioxygenase (phytanoyl-CoA dioxygenase family)